MRPLACAIALPDASAARAWLTEGSTCPWWLAAAVVALLSMTLLLAWQCLRRAKHRERLLRSELGEARQAHSALRDSEVAMHAGLAGVGQALLVVGSDGESVRYATPNVGAILGLEVDVVRGRPAGELFGADVATRLRGQQSFSNLRVALEQVGKLRIVRIDARLVPALGPAWVLACRDVTDEVELERQAQTQRRAADDALHLASLGALVSSLAHEINNPNHTITLNVQVLRSAWQGVIPLLDELQRQRGEFKIANFPYTDMREEVLRMVDAIYQGADRIRAIVTGLRDYARDYGRRQMVTLETAPLLEQIAARALVFKPELRGRLRLSLAPGLPAVRGNANLLAHALLDLLLIAADDRGGGGGEVEVIARGTPGPRLALEILGLGPPQQAKELARLAQAFESRGEDVGLDNWRLALANWIVQQQRGELQAEPRGEDRATWRISFPGVERE